MDRDELKDDTDRALARLGAATLDLTPDPRFVDAVLDAAEASGTAADPLAGIARATSSLAADEALTGAVLARVGQANDGVPVRSTGRRTGGAPSWLDGVVRTGPAAVGLAALAAAASFLLFLSTQRDADAALVSSVDIVEVSE